MEIPKPDLCTGGPCDAALVLMCTPLLVLKAEEPSAWNDSQFREIIAAMGLELHAVFASYGSAASCIANEP